MASINIRGATVGLSTNTTATGGTSVTALVDITQFPETGGMRRNATELDDTTEVYKAAKLATFSGELVFTTHAGNSLGALGGTTQYVFVNILTGEGTETAITTVSFIGVCTKDTMLPGDNESEVKREIHFTPISSPTFV